MGQSKPDSKTKKFRSAPAQAQAQAQTNNCPPCLHESGEGLLLRLYVQPGASTEETCGLQDAGNGDMRLKLKVRARAQEGAANEAVIALLAKVLDLPKSSITLTAGSTARLKTVKLPGSTELVKRVAALCSQR